MAATGMKPSDEASARSLEFAQRQGEAMLAALRHMTGTVAHDGGETRSGDYLVAYAVEEAEGLYEWTGGKLEWHEPETENVHVEVAVCDAADGRLLPGLDVSVTLIAPGGEALGPHRMPFLWHPWLHHYGRNWTVPGDGTYRLRIRIEPPRWQRHDERNGNRFTEPVEVEFDHVEIETGRK